MLGFVLGNYTAQHMHAPFTASQSPHSSEVESSAPLWRCLAAGLYECGLLFAVMFFSSLLFFIAVSGSPSIPANALQHPESDIFSIFILMVFGAYFGYFWTRGGQTLAMKTWDIRVVQLNGKPLKWPLAIGRYLLAWVTPLLLAALLTLGLMSLAPAPLRSRTALLYPMVLVLLVLLIFGLARFDGYRRFWHDKLLGTRLVAVQINK